jgi:hypothetical protein
MVCPTGTWMPFITSHAPDTMVHIPRPDLPQPLDFLRLIRGGVLRRQVACECHLVQDQVTLSSVCPGVR